MRHDDGASERPPHKTKTTQEPNTVPVRHDMPTAAAAAAADDDKEFRARCEVSLANCITPMRLEPLCAECAVEREPWPIGGPLATRYHASQRSWVHKEALAHMANWRNPFLDKDGDSSPPQYMDGVGCNQSVVITDDRSRGAIKPRFQ